MSDGCLNKKVGIGNRKSRKGSSIAIRPSHPIRPRRDCADYSLDPRREMLFLLPHTPHRHCQFATPPLCIVFSSPARPARARAFVSRNPSPIYPTAISRTFPPRSRGPLASRHCPTQSQRQRRARSRAEEDDRAKANGGSRRRPAAARRGGRRRPGADGQRRRCGECPAAAELLRQLVPERGVHGALRHLAAPPAELRRRARHAAPLLPRLLRPGNKGSCRRRWSHLVICLAVHYCRRLPRC